MAMRKFDILHILDRESHKVISALQHCLDCAAVYSYCGKPKAHRIANFFAKILQAILIFLHESLQLNVFLVRYKKKISSCLISATLQCTYHLMVLTASLDFFHWS